MQVESGPARIHAFLLYSDRVHSNLLLLLLRSRAPMILHLAEQQNHTFQLVGNANSWGLPLVILIQWAWDGVEQFTFAKLSPPEDTKTQGILEHHFGNIEKDTFLSYRIGAKNQKASFVSSAINVPLWNRENVTRRPVRRLPQSDNSVAVRGLSAVTLSYKKKKILYHDYCFQWQESIFIPSWPESRNFTEHQRFVRHRCG